MPNTIEKIITPKVGLLNPAEELENASRACKVMGLSRDLINTRQLFLPLTTIATDFNSIGQVLKVKNNLVCTENKVE